ncbi:phage portal protein family protein [Tenacibaculum maritimum]|uniref:phage portal protein family protein n=1 Tax=Tenacibaculum maritimum TaxID=107401 RepID=UPI0012E4F3FF|nr:DUF935 family protein [Tenacibaculum maritimum]CAA0158893.1 conserved hypothetical protein [Tenacibaculum maritimum]
MIGLKNVFGWDIGVKKSTPKSKVNPRASKPRRNPKITKIGEQFKDQSRKDIDKWRKALQLIAHPTEPKFDIYYDLVEDLLTDGHLQSQIQMRKMSVLNTDFHVVNRKTKKTNEDLTFILQQQWFYKFLEQGTNKLLFGTGLIEFLEFNQEMIEHRLIPRRNVISTQLKIIPDLQKPDFIDYSDDFFKAWLIQLGESGDLGIINNIIPNLIWTKNVTQAWAEFCEKFGMPLITATTNSTDSTTIDNVHEMLLELGEASVGTFPHGTEIKFQEASRTDAYNTYLQFIRTNQDIISKQLVGSTMLSDQGTNRSQTEVHERSLDNKIALADKRDIQFIVNNQLFPLLKLQRYSISEDDVFEFKKVKEEVNTKELWKITQGLLASGYQIQTDWISSTFNIPIEGKKKSPVVTNKPSKEPNNILYKYPQNCCPEHVTALGKNITRKLKELTKSLIEALHKGNDTSGIIGKMISAEGLELFNGLRSSVTPHSSYTTPDLLMLQLMEYNIIEFAASKTEARLASMTELLIDKESNKLRSFNEFKNLAEDEVKQFNTNYLLTEYNLAVSVGQNSAAFVRFMAEKDSVTSLVQYQTAGDDKVRSSHQVLDGKVFDLNDIQAMDLLPPNGYGCRCEFVQYLGDKSQVTKGTKAKELLRESDPKYKGSSFEINRANLSQVFTKKDFYSSTKNLQKRLGKLTFRAYGLKTYKNIKGSLNKASIDKTITKNNAHELFKKSGTITKGKTKQDYVGFSDYLKRKMILTKDVFKKHVADDKFGLYPLVKQALKNPDEVWYYEHTKDVFKSRYVSFFKDGILVIDADLYKKQGLNITSWNFVKDNNDKEIRKGLLIKTK